MKSFDAAITSHGTRTAIFSQLCPTEERKTDWKTTTDSLAVTTTGTLPEKKPRKHLYGDNRKMAAGFAMVSPTAFSYSTYRVPQNKIPHRRICNISATSGLISKIFGAALS